MSNLADNMAQLYIHVMFESIATEIISMTEGNTVNGFLPLQRSPWLWTQTSQGHRAEPCCQLGCSCQNVCLCCINMAYHLHGIMHVSLCTTLSMLCVRAPEWHVTCSPLQHTSRNARVYALLCMACLFSTRSRAGGHCCMLIAAAQDACVMLPDGVARCDASTLLLVALGMTCLRQIAVICGHCVLMGTHGAL